MIFPFIVGQYDGSDLDIPRTAWDTVQLGQFTLPGISKVSPPSRKRKASIKTPKGQSYETIKDTGLELARVTITNTIIAENELDQLVQILKYFDTQLGVKVTSGSGTLPGFAVNHPALQARDINTLYIEEIIGPEAVQPGYIITVFKCIEVKNVVTQSTSQVNPNNDFAEGTAYAPTKLPTPPSQNSNTTGPSL
jgi:hypothetical protein